jgi:hypothetical protein
MVGHFHRFCHVRALFLTLVLGTGVDASAQHRWPAERQAGQFLCHADFPLEPRQRLLDELVELQRDVCTLLGAEPPREYIHLFLFQDKNTYQSYLQRHFPRVPYRRALFIKARGPGMVFAYEGAEFEIDVRHECTHALLHAWLPGDIPLWLDEGLAEYFEVKRGQRASQNPHHELVRIANEIGQPPRLEALESLKTLEEMGRDEYRGAWAFVHFLLRGPRPAREELLAYLRDLHAEAEPGALSHRLRRRLPDFDRQFAAHFERAQAAYLRPMR